MTIYGKEDGIITAYKNYKPEAQEQDLPGTEADMQPLAYPLEIECWDNDGNPYLEEYQGSGKLKGTSILITGGDSGIGRSAALMLAREGADISIAYLPEEQKDAEWVKNAVSKAPHGSKKCLLIPCDLQNEESAKKVIDAHVKEYGRINVLVNNASKQMKEKEFEKIDMAQVRSTFESNILGMFALTKYAIPHIPRGGSIINTASVVAYRGTPQMIDYASTKGAIVSFTRSLATHLAPKGIRVNAVAPGPVYTPLQPASRTPEEMEGWETGKPPLRGRMAQPAELGPAYVFLASNMMSGTMSAQVLHLNLGQLAAS
ncbi:NAD(P)-binding protein [Exidia glandulosa HHB12029]|uniref:NAD(P)-binding protein n=1 Tax=Exidia glandulosa HHB12029 TaxID=1314781 RepID=A0A165MC91_EXIGL|nr:NAD(P)-binding protein [Exidia glandulosa HHB12029]